MSYIYTAEREKLFTDEGQRLFLGIRDNVQSMLQVSGAVRMGEVLTLPAGYGAAEVWTMMACVDRMVELGELRELPTDGCGQDRVFVAGSV